MITRGDIEEALHVPCPVHKMRDCSPLLNGCTWWQTIQEQARRIEAMIEKDGEGP